MKSFLGTGWGFPIEFKKRGGTDNGVVMASEVEDIAQSLTILLRTRPGERIMRPDYGCALEDLLFEPLNLNLITYIKELIKNSILYYEPRVNLVSIDIATDPALILQGKVLIKLGLVVRSTNARHNYVYDYYKREATITPTI